MKNVIIVGSFPVSEYANVDRQLDDDEFQNLLDQNEEVRTAFESFQASCRQLGKQLAQKKTTIFVGSDRKVDADLYVVEGANEAGGKPKVVVYTPHNWPWPAFIEKWSTLGSIDADYWRVPGPWDKATAHIIRKVDAVFVIGGGNSTLQAGMSAPALGKPVIALTAFKGTAAKVFDTFYRNYTESGMSREHLQAFENPFNTADSVDKILTATERFVNKNPYVADTHIKTRIAVLVTVLALILCWGFVFWYGAQQPGTTVVDKWTRSVISWLVRMPNDEQTTQAQQEAERVDADDPKAKVLTPNRQQLTEYDATNSNGLDAGRGDDSRPNPANGDADGRSSPPDKAEAGKEKQGNPASGDGDPKPSPTPTPNSQPTPDEPGDNPDEENGNGGEPAGKPDQPATPKKLGQDIGDSMGMVIIILIVSAMLGSALRAGLRLLQDQVVTLGDVVNEIIVGLLLSFSLLIVYLAAGVLFEGDVLESTPSNFRRLAVTVSAFALASAFLLENAANEVRRRLGQTLQR